MCHRREDSYTKTDCVCAALRCSVLQNVVIMGSGSFAAEAMEAAGRNGAAHITIISRKRSRWAAQGLALLRGRLPVWPHPRFPGPPSPPKHTYPDPG